MTTRWLVANWKMNGDAASARAYAFAINQALMQSPPSLACVFCPPTIFLPTAKQNLPANARLLLGGQNCHHEVSGAFTGEISAKMLAGIGARYVIVGHSERRAMGETDALTAAKAEKALAAGLTPIICIGESRADYEAKRTNSVLDTQLAPLASLPLGSYLIAYEPIWAIGSSVTPQMAEISAAHQHIKSVLGSGTHVLYGGSVNGGNIGEILKLPEVAGALIGGASLEIDNMRAMIDIAAK